MHNPRGDATAPLSIAGKVFASVSGARGRGDVRAQEIGSRVEFPTQKGGEAEQAVDVDQMFSLTKLLRRAKEREGRGAERAFVAVEAVGGKLGGAGDPCGR